MPSEKFRKIFPYISISVGILVYVLYYMSTQSWNEAKAEYERQEVQRRLAEEKENEKLISQSMPWISSDGKEIYKLISRENKDGLIWIKLKEINEDMTYNLRKVESATGEKYTSKAGNLFWIKSDEAIFENNEKKKSNLKKAKLIEGLFSYIADANSFILCESNVQVSIAMLGDNANIESEYSKFNKAGEEIYLEVVGAMIKEKSIEGSEMIDAIYPYKLIHIENRSECK